MLKDSGDIETLSARYGMEISALIIIILDVLFDRLLLPLSPVCTVVTVMGCQGSEVPPPTDQLLSPFNGLCHIYQSKIETHFSCTNIQQ